MKKFTAVDTGWTCQTAATPDGGYFDMQSTGQKRRIRQVANIFNVQSVG
jgi:hypothetical protein